jgi:hypothetical protein
VAAAQGQAAADDDVDSDGNEVAAGDDTVGSQPFGSADRWFQPGPAINGAAVPGAGAGGRAARQTRRARATRRVLIAAAFTAVAVALVAAGWVGATSARGKPASSGRPIIELGPELAPPPGGPPGGQNGLGPGIGNLQASPGVPVIGVSQPTGDRDTGFVIHGQSWPPGKPLTIDLVGVRVSPIRPIADQRGMFSYVINQDHEFFPGGLPQRIYTVRVTGTNGTTAIARFEVLS